LSSPKSLDQKIVDISDESIMLEITGDPGKNRSYTRIIKKYRVLKIARTGKIVLEEILELIQNTQKHFNQTF
jgi:acetolactate synthase small subunit